MVFRGFNERNEYLKARKKKESQGVAPLQTLRAKINEDQSATHYVVISVGGNDFRVKLARPWTLLGEIFVVQKRYLQILDRVKGMVDQNVVPTLMFQYRIDSKDQFYHIYKIFKGLFFFVATLNTIAI